MLKRFENSEKQDKKQTSERSTWSPKHARHLQSMALAYPGDIIKILTSQIKENGANTSACNNISQICSGLKASL